MATSAISDELVVDLFAALFEGNGSRLGTEDGGSVETDEFWIDIIEAHLTGESKPIGAYPIDPRDGLTRWGCVDFDLGVEESWPHAFRLAYVLKEHEVSAWVERSRSKGFHVWTFCKDWVDPAIMRHALIYACNFADAPCKEVNPKQERLTENQVGNYVRLPYPGGLKLDKPTEARSVVSIATGELLPVDVFVLDAWDSRCEPDALHDLARRYEPPEVKGMRAPQLVYIDESYGRTEELLEELGKTAKRLFNSGPKDADRSATLVALAGDIARSRVFANRPDEFAAIKEVLVSADAKWGKYSTRNDTETRLDEIVDKVLGERDSLY